MTKLIIVKFIKDILLVTRLLQIFQPISKLFEFIYNFNSLTSWIHHNKKGKYLINDFYRLKRNYEDRMKSYEAIFNFYDLGDAPLCYLEYGVAGGVSFKWWLKKCINPASRFYGFDTFEGLPESWGVYAKGDMNEGMPVIEDERGKLIKGIFQDTLNDFLFAEGKLFKEKRKVIHLDADLFSSTLFVLSQLYPYLQKGDILMFDEFNVCNHEYLAFKNFTECFYVNLKPIAAQNNYLHAAFEVM